MNTNCLKDFKCPKCGSFEPFDIVIDTVITIWDAGELSDTPYGCCWTDESKCTCPNCGFHSTVAAFQIRRFDHLFSVGFSVLSDHRGEDVTAQEILDGLRERLKFLEANPDEVLEAVGLPEDTSDLIPEEEEEDEP